MNTTILKLDGTDDFFTQEAYKTLRTNLQFCGADVRVIALTSCNENEGKSTISMNLGKSLAELGKQVLVIDADMRKSVMAGRNTNAKKPVGLSEILTGMISIGDGIYSTQYENLHMIFAGKYPPNPVELLSGRYFAALLKECRKVYDYVIIDTPPLGMVIDAAVIAPLCDGTAIVMAENRVRSKQALELMAQLKKTDCKILGVIRNQVGGGKSSYYKKNSKYYSAYGK